MSPQLSASSAAGLPGSPGGKAPSSSAPRTRGATRRVATTNARHLDVHVVPGTGDGQTLRLEGQGMPGVGGGEAGDA